jgi:Ca-activated chloride channel family protein
MSDTKESLVYCGGAEALATLGQIQPKGDLPDQNPCPLGGCLRNFAAAAVLLLLGWERPATASDRFTTNSRLVLVPVTVTDRNGKTVSGLQREHFQVMEDAQSREILSLTREEGAMGLGIVLDLSGSMRHKTGPAQSAARAVASGTGAGDEIFLMTFADHTGMRVPMTRDREWIAAGLTGLRAGGNTALIDAIYRALAEVRASSHRRKALVLISDGGDNASRYSEAELKRWAQESDAQIYSISIVEGVRNQAAWRGADMLDDLAEITGGLHFTIRDHRELPAVAERLARAMKEVYVIAYKPGEAQPGKWRKVRVSVTSGSSKNLRVTARSGYYLPE